MFSKAIPTTAHNAEKTSVAGGRCVLTSVRLKCT